jgi:hypothetical protein
LIRRPSRKAEAIGRRVVRALVVYESGYGNTHAVAEQIAAGPRPVAETRVLSDHDGTADQGDWADVVVVGGPTDAHGMTSTSTRRGGLDAVPKPGSGLQAQADASGPGLRDWFRGLDKVTERQGVAFDSRFDSVTVLTGLASQGIARRLRGRGFAVGAEPEAS